MVSTSLICPQCGAALPSQARWRTVECLYCSAIVSPRVRTILAADYRAAYERSLADDDAGSRIVCAGRRYRVLDTLAADGHVLLAQCLGAGPERVVIKLAQGPDAARALQHEAAVLRQLQAAALPGAAYFSQRLPQLVAHGAATGNVAHGTQALVLRHPVGYWGSLADVRRHYPQGIDPRHAVWMWRRMLDVLGYVHAAGWAHGRLAPEHLLVHPADHGILIIGWSRAQRIGAAATAARDLMQTAWSLRSLLHGGGDDNDGGGGDGGGLHRGVLVEHALDL
ncbi:MAG: lipopolysaccharide kinase InaA family protein, partial [Duganella sp.]